MSRFRTPLKNVRGLGSAKTGTQHFVNQRLTATALTLLAGWFMVFIIRVAGSDYATAHAMISQPLNAIFLVTFLISMFWHAQLGLQVVLEDYVHTSLLALVVQTLVRFVAVLATIISVFSVINIAIGMP